jgi:hypothetical protein
VQSGSHLRLHGSWLATHWRCRSVCSSLRLFASLRRNGSGRCACLTHPSRRKHIAAPLFQLETVNTGTVRLCATRLCRCGVEVVLADFARCALRCAALHQLSLFLFPSPLAMSAPPPFVHTAQRSAERAMRSSAEKRCAACSHRRDAQRIRLPSSPFSVVSLLAAVQSADGPRVRALLHLAQPAPADNDTTAAAAAAVAPAPSSPPDPNVCDTDGSSGVQMLVVKASVRSDRCSRRIDLCPRRR